MREGWLANRRARKSRQIPNLAALRGSPSRRWGRAAVTPHSVEDLTPAMVSFCRTECTIRWGIGAHTCEKSSQGSMVDSI